MSNLTDWVGLYVDISNLLNHSKIPPLLKSPPRRGARRAGWVAISSAASINPRVPTVGWETLRQHRWSSIEIYLHPDDAILQVPPHQICRFQAL
jgi:hypothetical protein